MGQTHLVIPDQHAHPDFGNERADWLGQLILDLRPDVLINMGDAGDFSSLSSYDRGKRSFHGKSYRRDLDAHLDFQERMWAPIRKAKKKRPYSIFLEGNHEERIERALDLSPELVGTVGFKDLELDRHYNEVVRYDGNIPGIVTVDGISYAHFFISGNLGRPIGGEHIAYSLLAKKHVSCTQGHSHTFDFSTRTDVHGRRINGLVCGVFQDYRTGWAGPQNDLWWRGVVIKRNVHEGHYDLETVSVDTLRKAYGS